MRYRSCEAQSYARRVELVEIQGKGEYFQNLLNDLRKFLFSALVEPRLECRLFSKSF